MCPRRSRPAARPGFVRARPQVCTGHVLYVCEMGEGREERIEETTEEELQGLDEEGRVVAHRIPILAALISACPASNSTRLEPFSWKATSWIWFTCIGFSETTEEELRWPP